MSKELAQLVKNHTERDLSYKGDIPSHELRPLTDNEIENARLGESATIHVDSWEGLWADY